MTDQIHDPVHRSRYTFQAVGENMTVDTWIEPGGGLPGHMHPRQEERWSVIEGRIRFMLGGRKRVIGAEDGEMIVAPGVKHSLASAGSEEAHLRCLVLPAYGLQDFLEESAAAAREGLIMRGDIPRGLRGLRWGASFLARYQEDVVMAFPPRIVQRALIALFAR